MSVHIFFQDRYGHDFTSFRRAALVLGLRGCGDERREPDLRLLKISFVKAAAADRASAGVILAGAPGGVALGGGGGGRGSNRRSGIWRGYRVALACCPPQIGPIDIFLHLFRRVARAAGSPVESEETDQRRIGPART